MSQQDKAGARVTVACKLPAGLVIRGFQKVTERESVVGGGTRDFDVFRPTDEQAVINGPASAPGMAPKCRVSFGYAITPNVKKDLFDSWLEANRDNPYVKNKLIFAFEADGMIDGAAKENEKRVSGFEMIDPEDPGKKVRGIAKNIAK
jgi:hypothetical protein